MSGSYGTVRAKSVEAGRVSN
jgi:putative transposase